MNHGSPDGTREVVFKTFLLTLDATKSPHIDDDTGLPMRGFKKLSCFSTRGLPLLLSGDILAVGDRHGSIWLHDARTGAVIYELNGGGGANVCPLA